MVNDTLLVVWSIGLLVLGVLATVLFVAGSPVAAVFLGLTVVWVIIGIYFLWYRERGGAAQAAPRATAAGVPSADTIPESPASGDTTEVYVPEVVKPRAFLSELPVETIEGIGTAYGMELRNAGIVTVDDLLAAEPERVAEICGVSVKMAERWISMSRFTWMEEVSEEDAEALVAVGMTELKELAAADPYDLFDRIRGAVDRGEVQVPEGYEISVEAVQKWIEAAKDLTSE